MAKETMRLQIDQQIDPFAACIKTSHDDTHHLAAAWLDLDALPRLEPLLVGKAIATVPDLITKLCGICPIPHHLAGVAALEQLLGFPAIPAPARLIRALLLQASMLTTLSLRLPDRKLASQLYQTGVAATRALGVPGHFPAIAVPGGVQTTLNLSLWQNNQATALQEQLAQVELPSAPFDLHLEKFFTKFIPCGLTNQQAQADLLGDFVSLAGATPTPAASTSFTEVFPHTSDPRPTVAGQQICTGPLARLKLAGLPVTSPLAATVWQLQQALAALNAGFEQLAKDQLTGPQTLVAPAPDPQPQAGASGFGIVDGPRGLLVHRYACDEHGQLAAAQILTPTALNAGWLAAMLTAFAEQPDGFGWAIHTADPCLPVAAAPPAAMNLTIVPAPNSPRKEL